MFLTIREWFHRRRSGDRIPGRKRRIARLFVFEFVIVVLGVLVAQTLQLAFASQLEEQRGREVAKQLESAAFHFAAIGDVGQRNRECFNERLDRLFTANVAGERVAMDEVGRPKLSGVYESQWDAGAFAAARTARDEMFIARAQELVGLFEEHDALAARLAEEWQKIELLDASNGPLSQADRSAIRDALIAARADWRRAQEIYREVESIAQAWGVPEKNPDLDHHLPDLETCQFVPFATK